MRAAHLSVFPTCEACGGRRLVDVHHTQPYDLKPELELEPSNLITLCMAAERHCHLLIGHGDDFLAFNPNVVADALAALHARGANDEATVSEIVESARSGRQFVLAATNEATRSRASG